MTIPAAEHIALAEDGARIRWRESGRGEPVLLISGQAVDSRPWNAVVPDFGERYRVITFDHRGTGGSAEGSDASYSTRGFAADARAVLDAAGAERAHVYGHSMGGRVAQWLAIDAPERVGALVLGATTAGDARGVRRSAQASADLVGGDPAALARLFFRDGERHPGADAFFDSSASRRARRLHYAASRDHDAWDHLASITAPTLIVHGSDDEMTPPGNAERMAVLIPGAELVLLAGARHGYYLDDARASGTVLRFLQRHPIKA